MGPLANERAVSIDVMLWSTLHILVGKICIIFFLFYCEGMLSLVVLWLCGRPVMKVSNLDTIEFIFNLFNCNFI